MVTSMIKLLMHNMTTDRNWLWEVKSIHVRQQDEVSPTTNDEVKEICNYT